MQQYYAHTGKSEFGIKAQLYDDHIRNMYNGGVNSTKILSPFLRKATLIAILFHDFGKLESTSQKVLCQDDQPKDTKLVNHVDAGVAWCIREYNKKKDASFIYAAYLVHAHHIGLKNRDDLFTSIIKLFGSEIAVTEDFRDTKFNDIINNTVAAHNDAILDELYAIQYQLLKKEIDEALQLTYSKKDVKPVELRFALSVLVEEDHGDTSRHYSIFKNPMPELPRNEKGPRP
jgi:CRISPR/Cas system-associated endonuclease Cas3-HD